MVHINFADLEVAYTPEDLAVADFAKLARINQALLDQRVMIGGGSRMVISDGLTDEDIDETLVRMERALTQL